MNAAAETFPLSRVDRGKHRLAQLVGRREWIWLCHDRPAECRVCLRRIAFVIATEMGFEVGLAVDRPLSAYRRDLGEEMCTAEQAAELRRLVCAACRRPADVDPGEVMVADELPEAFALMPLPVETEAKCFAGREAPRRATPYSIREALAWVGLGASAVLLLLLWGVRG